MSNKTEFDEEISKVIPSLFYTISSAAEGEESEESYNVNKVFPKLPHSTAHGKCGSVCTAAFLQHQYIHHRKGPQSVVKTMKDMRRVLQESKFLQTPLVSSSRPIDSDQAILQIAPPGTQKRRALLIGICYSGDHSLRSSHSDCLRVRDMLVELHGFSEDDMVILMDDGKHLEPTKKNIEDGFLQLALDSEPGDVNFISFSGHGGRIVDRDGDEESGFDSNFFPVDHRESGYILDDDILTMLVKPMKAGVTTTALIDCCHSANIFDLPYMLSSHDTKMERKKGFNMDIVTEAVRPISAKEKAKERYRREKQKKKAERAASEGVKEKSSSLEPKTTSMVDAAPVPTKVTRNNQGQIVITGNPSPEELAAIQNQMIKEAQEAAFAQMSLTGGQRGQITVVPGKVMTGTGVPPTGLTMKQNSGPQFVNPTVTAKAPPFPATIPRTKVTPTTPTPVKPKPKMKVKEIIHSGKDPCKYRASSDSRDKTTKVSYPVPSKAKNDPKSSATEKAKRSASVSHVEATTPVPTKPIKKSSTTKKKVQPAHDSMIGKSTAASTQVPSKPKKKEKAPVAVASTNQPNNHHHHHHHKNAVYYSADDLRNQTVPGLDYTKRETYLSPTEFQSIFGMSRAEFDPLPPWKRTQLKRQQRLF